MMELRDRTNKSQQSQILNPLQQQISTERAEDKSIGHRVNYQLSIMPKMNQFKAQKKSISVPVAKRHKSLCELVLMCSIVAISAFQFGYILPEFSTIPFSNMITYYNINFNSAAALGLINGLLPIGGIFGSILNKYTQIYFSRRNAHHPMTILTLISVVLSLVPAIQSLLIGRFIVGISCGLYTATSPVYLKDIAPKQLRPTLGTFFTNGRVIGIVFCYGLGIFCQYVCPDAAIYIMVGVPGVMAILQSIGAHFYLADSPPEMVIKRKDQELEKAIARIYKPQHVAQVVAEYKKQYDMEIVKRKSQMQVKNKQIIGEYVDYTANKRRAFLMALHISMLRQMVGTNFIVVYSSQAMQPINATIAPFTPLVINTVQLCCGIFATLYITYRFGRRPMLLFGVGTLTLWNFGIAIGFYYENAIPILLFMILMMMSFGSAFSPVCWPYPTQIIPPDKVPYTTFVNWVGVTLITALPPLILSVSRNAYPIFFFFGAWTFFSTIYIYFGAIEIKGLTYQQIVARF